MSARAELFRIRPYLRFQLGNAVSALGYGMQFIASSWLLLELTGKHSSVALLLIASMLPGLLLAPFAGVWVDRANRQKLAAWVDLLRAAVVLAVPLLMALGRLEAWHLYVMEALLATGDVVFRPATMALVREVVPQPLLLTANVYSRVFLQVGMIVGAGTGGLILAATSSSWVMVVNGLTFLVSSACIASMGLGHLRRAGVGARVTALEDFRAGLRYVRAHSTLVLPYLILLSLWTVSQVLNTLLPGFAKDVLRVGSQGFGFIDAAWAVGSVLGGLLLTRVVTALGRARAMVWGVFLLSGAILATSSVGGLAAAVLCAALMGAFVCVGILYQTHVQERTPLEMQGRVESLFRTLSSAVMLLVYAGMGWLAEHWGARAGFVVQGAFILLAGFGAVWMVRGRAGRALEPLRAGD